jgi:hypothetical protein
LSNKSEISDDRDNKGNGHEFYPFFKWGELHTPFMIYVRSHNTLSDEVFMELFGLQGYHRVFPPLPFLGRRVVFANDSEWTHIADDTGYTLWRSPKTSEVIAELSKNYDVFRNSIGDIDNSFEFEYHQAGKLIRKFVFEHDVFKGAETVTADTGVPLLGEPATLRDLKASAEKMFPTITQPLGIVRVTDPLQNRFYGKQAG